MSLLLDARKKSQQSQSSRDGGNSGIELSMEALPNSSPPAVTATSSDQARSAGQNLFSAKSSAAPLAHAGINRNLLIALGVTVLLLSAGGVYVWYATQPPNLVAAISPVKAPAVAIPQPQNNLVPDIVSPQTASPKRAGTARLAHAAQSAGKSHQARRNNPILFEQHHDEPIDPLLNSAYAAYRGGKFEQAQQLYRDVLKLDQRNIDAILGLAVIAQRRGADNMAANYYAQALALDPRNAVANAGMSALTTDDNRESSLKSLLIEQQDSSALHFALGNLYAEQGHWGEAQQAYFNAFRLEPSNAQFAFNLATSLDHLGQGKLAAQYYGQALQLGSSGNAGFDRVQTQQRMN